MNNSKYQNLHVRMNSDVKQQFNSILEQMGLNPSTAINIFARLVIQEKALPFSVSLKTDSQVIEEARQATREIGQDAVKRGISDMSMDDIDAIIARSRKERQANNGY